jgi:uncharacterized protein YqfA (UPF0365 family)
MRLFADNGLTTWDIVGFVAIFAAFLVLVVILAVIVRFFRLWVQSATTGAGIGFLDMLGMTFRRVPPEVIVRSKIMAVQSGLTEADTGMTTRSLEAHYLARGNVPKVVRAWWRQGRPRLSIWGSSSPRPSIWLAAMC